MPSGLLCIRRALAHFQPVWLDTSTQFLLYKEKYNGNTISTRLPFQGHDDRI